MLLQLEDYVKKRKAKVEEARSLFLSKEESKRLIKELQSISEDCPSYSFRQIINVRENPGPCNLRKRLSRGKVYKIIMPSSISR